MNGAKKGREEIQRKGIRKETKEVGQGLRGNLLKVMVGKKREAIYTLLLSRMRRAESLVVSGWWEEEKVDFGRYKKHLDIIERFFF